MLVYNGPVKANAQGEELYGHGTAGFPCGYWITRRRQRPRMALRQARVAWTVCGT